MPEVPVGSPHPSGNRECREGPPGQWFWWDEIIQDFQEVDEHGAPIGDPYPKTVDWVNSGEPCQP